MKKQNELMITPILSLIMIYKISTFGYEHPVLNDILLIYVFIKFIEIARQYLTACFPEGGAIRHRKTQGTFG
jgi:hypothetical protein